MAVRIFKLPKVEVATDMRLLFELLKPTETDLDGFKVTLLISGRDRVLWQLNADELSTTFLQLLSIYPGGIIIRLYPN
jgi:hypothetical protein